jgi:hypothetical protein
MADSEATERAKKQLDEDKKIRERSAAEYAERSRGKPTPTQEEIDLAVLGANFTEHEADGSAADPAGGPQDIEKVLEKGRQEYAEAMAAGPPTPNQEELDKAVMGQVVTGTKAMEAGEPSKPQTYQTRQMRTPLPSPPKTE